MKNGDIEQLEDWIDLPQTIRLKSDLERPITWIVPAKAYVPYWIKGVHHSLAVRITEHPVAATLCEASDSALVSTSANVTGNSPIRSVHILRRRFSGLVDCIVPGQCGPAAGPSEIRDLKSGKILRTGKT